MKISKKQIICFLIINFIILMPYLFIDLVGWDYNFHYTRIVSISENIKNGIFLPNIQSHNVYGYGYLVDVFYPSLFLYLPACLSFIFSVKFSIFLSLYIYSFIASILYYKISMKIFNNETFSRNFSLLYIINFCNLYFLYRNSSFSSYIGALLIPFFIFGIYDIFYNNKRSILVISFSLLIYSHIISAYISAIFLIICIFINIKNVLTKKLFLSLLKAFIEISLISIGFIFPFLEGWFNNKLLINNYMKNSGDYLIITSIIKNVSTKKAIIFTLIFFILIFCIYFKLKNKKNNLHLKVLLLIIFYLFMLTSLFPWELISKIPSVTILQYTSRMFIIPVCLSIMLFCKKDNYFKIIIFLLHIIILANIGNYKISLFKTTNEQQILNNEKAYVGTWEYAPLDFQKEYNQNNNINIDFNAFTIKNKDIDITQNKNKTIIFLKEDNYKFVINKFYYSYYNIYQKDNPNIKISSKNGLIEIQNAKKGYIFLLYENTITQYLSFCFSISFILFLLFKKFVVKNNKAGYNINIKK